MNSIGIFVNYVYVVRRMRWYFKVKGRKELYIIIFVIIGLIFMFI